MTDAEKIGNNNRPKINISPVTRFVLVFLILLILISIGFSQLFTRFHDNFLWLMDSTASICGGTMSLFSDDVACQDRFISYKEFPIEIIDECTGLFEMLIFLATVFSFPTSIRNKLIGVLIGVPIIYIFNIIRIIVLLIAGAYSRAAFDFMHLYLWQVTLIIMIGSIWIGWLYLFVDQEKRIKTVSA